MMKHQEANIAFVEEEMSYRRDARRDSPRNSGNYGGGMNRRQNYGGGGGGGGVGLGQVSPWQGGLVPGVNQLGLLPSHGGQSSLLSQLSSPEAQLAMATNLLNKILSPQEQSQPSVPPSLLSLPINRNMAAFNDSRSRWTSYADRRRDNRPDNRRMQPYNKSGSNRHQDGKARFNSEKNSRFNSDKTVSPKPKKKETEKKIKEEKDAKLNGGAAADDKEDSESKRKEEDEEGDGKKKDDSSSESKASSIAKYTGIPQGLLACHVCHKNMWDATSFDKHVSGRRHQMMMEQQDETYKIKVELLRHEQRAAESQREMEIERLQRQGKKVFNNKRAYCTMCDLHFFGNLISHRKKERHQKLKAFLHPKCRLCHKEFANRLEWDDHKLSAAHLLKVADHRRNKKPGIKDDEIEFLDDDSLDENDDDLFTPTKEKKIDFDLTDIPTTIDDYDPEKAVGDLLVAEVTGHLCRGCNKFLASKEEVESHLHSYTHYKSYALLVKAKAKAEKDKAKKDKPVKEGEDDDEDADGEEEEDEQSESEKPSEGGDSEGTWKRRKRGSGASKANNGAADEDAEDESETQPETKVKEEKMEVEVKAEKYDPDKADEEDEEEEEEEPEVPKTPRSTPSRNKAVRGGARGKARRGGK